MRLPRWLIPLLLVTLPVSAAILRVPADHAGIQAAFDASAEGDTVLVARGTWTELLVTPGHTLTLCSNYLFSHDTTDIQETILDGQYAGTILEVASEADQQVTVCGLTFIHGQGVQTDIYAYCDRGGGINLQGRSNLELRDAVFMDCRAPRMGSVLNQGDECWFGAEGRLTIRNVMCIRNSLDDPQNIGGCIHIRSQYEGELLIDGLTMVGTGSVARPIVVDTGMNDLAVVRNVTFIDCHHTASFGFGLWPRVGSAEASNIHVIGTSYNRRVRFGIAFNSPGVPICRNICMEGIRAGGGGFALYITSGIAALQIDSLDYHDNRGSVYLESPTRYTPNYITGGLRNLHLYNNVVGDSAGGEPEPLLTAQYMDLHDASVHDNRLIIGPQANPDGTGGNYVGGAMISAEGPRVVENLHFANNHVDDMDDYSGLAGTYVENWGREIWAGSPYDLAVRHVRVEHSRAGNPCPECRSDLETTGPGSTVSFHASKLTLDDILLDDCDDGGINFSADSLWAQSITLRNVGRNGFFFGRYESPLVPVYVGLRNVSVQGVATSDIHLSPSNHIYSRQCLFSMDVVGAYQGILPVVELENVTATGCSGMYQLFNFWEGATLRIRNSVLAGNEYDQLVRWDNPINQEWSHSLVEETVPGEGNLIGLDPRFDAHLGPPFLAADSPCIDAGDPGPALNDAEDPANPGFPLWPAQGSLRNDMGFTGGPHAVALDTTWVSVPGWQPNIQPKDFSLGAPWPNPFNPMTHIPFTLTRPEIVKLSVHNLLGQEVAVLVNGFRMAGRQEVVLDGAGLASGLYVVTLDVAGHRASRTISLLR